MLVGSEDFLIDGVRQFADKMNAAGARCDLDLYDGRSHGFFNYRGNGKDFRATIESMDRFLALLGYLEGEPTVDEFFSQVPGDNPQRQ